MGKGDKKSRRGKISNSTFGVRRPRKIKKRISAEEKIVGKKKK
jgi:30S ribosomal protein S31